MTSTVQQWQRSWIDGNEVIGHSNVCFVTLEQQHTSQCQVPPCPTRATHIARGSASRGLLETCAEGGEGRQGCGCCWFDVNLRDTLKRSSGPAAVQRCSRCSGRQAALLCPSAPQGLCRAAWAPVDGSPVLRRCSEALTASSRWDSALWCSWRVSLTRLSQPPPVHPPFVTIRPLLL